ncbi:ESX secretion-associated protein EspG [Nocardia sp. NBC_01503]|uniref:ESX secretion-associated protein EspG n=1 Tax=Nocardia sp. NBC_01503 TaxID=2975997 RepID=UPI002E7C1207|nr:ESX secretion-associated protein EspG [Nocardia sp. NBC_01503]WTL33912.1 ESX secretion-associated protein EspG [Nocardia sp. NBC_01503]
MTTLTNDSVIALAAELGVQTLPLVLSVGPQQDSYTEWNLGQELARAELRTARILDSRGDVDPDTATALFVLAQPDCELAARIYTADGQVRVCLARRAENTVVAIRRGDSLDIRSIWTDGRGDSLARPILDALGAFPPAEVASFSALSTDLSERFDNATTSEDFASAVYSLGVADTDATVYGLALSSTHAYAEVVAYAYADGVTDRSPGAVVVYDTARGRIVAAPGIAPDQQVWSTLTPGTDHRVAQAISGLVESLPGGRWLS